ncbi:MAG: YwaF family protein [Clostridia bacterium]|nr:YwaF family protein [Clostridia bacterium]
MYQAMVFLCGAVIAAIVLLLFRKNEKTRRNVLKILTVVFCAIGFFRFFLSDSIILVINGGWYEGVYYDQTDFWHMILRWGYYTNYAVLPVAVFCESRLFKNVAGYFSLPFTVLSTVFFNDYMSYFLSTAGKGYHFDPTFRHVYFVVELALAFAIPLALHIGDKHIFNVKSGKEWANYLVGLPAIVLIMIPTYVVQGFFGTNMKIPEWFSSYHFTWIGITLGITILIYFVFRFKSYNERYTVCLFLVLVLFFHYNSLYLMGLTLKRLPFQLCNFAAYMYLVAFAFKWEKMFNFCFIANTVGTIFAIAVPDFGIGYTGFWNVHFLLEHSFVFIVPVICMGLRIFPRITKKSILHYFAGFTIYIIFCYILGTILNGYKDITGETVNYFYMFDFDTAFGYFPFLKFVENFYFEFGRFIVYPLVFVFVYVGFSALCMLFFLGVKVFYKFEDEWLEMHSSAVDLYEKITKKKSRLPKHYVD